MIFVTSYFECWALQNFNIRPIDQALQIRETYSVVQEYMFVYAETETTRLLHVIMWLGVYRACTEYLEIPSVQHRIDLYTKVCFSPLKSGVPEFIPHF